MLKPSVVEICFFQSIKFPRVPVASSETQSLTRSVAKVMKSDEGENIVGSISGIRSKEHAMEGVVKESLMKHSFVSIYSKPGVLWK